VLILTLFKIQSRSHPIRQRLPTAVNMLKMVWLPRTRNRQILMMLRWLRNLQKSVPAVCAMVSFVPKWSMANWSLPVSSLKGDDSPTFVQGSSRDGEINELSRRLEQSASFEEPPINKAWYSGEGADLWNF
jgi:hypothetical protein